MDDVLTRIEDLLLLLRCDSRSEVESVLIECLGALTEQVRRLRTEVEGSEPGSADT